MNKGFTLVELLGVIIILAVIATITTPIVLNIIEDAKEKSIEVSLNKYIDTVKNDISNYNGNNSLKNAECLIESDGNLNCNGIFIKISVEKKRPTSGIIVIKDYDVENYYGVTIENKTFNSIEFNGTKVEPNSNDTHKGIVYLDPTNLNNTCNENNIVNVNTLDEKKGCMKFYIYNDEGSNYSMILDRNVVGLVQWMGYSDYVANGGTDAEWAVNKIKFGPVTINKELKRVTSNWSGNPRMITPTEIAHIVGADAKSTIGWDKNKPYGSNASLNANGFDFDGSGTTYTDWNVRTVNSTNRSRYAWLYDNLASCINYGCNIEDNYQYPYITGEGATGTTTTPGYYTSEPVYGWDLRVWVVANQGYLGLSVPNNRLGIRPVITLPKILIDKT